MPLKHNIKWSGEKIVSRIKALHDAGVILAPGNVREKDPKLFNAAVGRRYFGNWRSALASAGVDPESEYRRYRIKLGRDNRWTRSSVLERIGELGDDELRCIHRRYPALYSAGRRCFGSWSKAIEEAGRDGRRERRRENALNELKEYIHVYGSAGVTSRNRSLYNKIYRYFGSWEKGLSMAGRADEE